MKIITIASLKGGVGKTTTAIFLALALKEKGKHVLVIDADPNNNMTDYFLRDSDPQAIEKRNLYHVLTGRCLSSDCIYLADVDIIPCTMSLHRVALEMGSMLRFGADLRKLDYDVVIIDTPPALGYELRTALHVSDLVLSPVGLSRWTVQALDILRAELMDVHECLGHAPTLFAVPGMVTQIEAATLRASSLSGKITNATIHKSTAIRKAATTGKVLKPGSKAALEFDELAMEVIS